MKKLSEKERKTHHIQMIMDDADHEKFLDVMQSSHLSVSSTMRNVFYSFYADWKEKSESEKKELWQK